MVSGTKQTASKSVLADPLALVQHRYACHTTTYTARDKAFRKFKTFRRSKHRHHSGLNQGSIPRSVLYRTTFGGKTGESILEASAVEVIRGSPALKSRMQTVQGTRQSMLATMCQSVERRLCPVGVRPWAHSLLRSLKKMACSSLKND